MALNRLHSHCHTFITLKKKRKLILKKIFSFLQPPSDCDLEGALWSINTVTFSCPAAVHLEPGSDFCCASRTKSPLLPGFPCLDWGAALGFWWMMFGPCRGLKKSSETDFSSHFWFFWPCSVAGLTRARAALQNAMEGTVSIPGSAASPSTAFQYYLTIFRIQKTCVSVSSKQGQRDGMEDRWLISPGDVLQLSPGFDAQR